MAKVNKKTLITQDLNSIKKRLQEHFTDGLVIIIGSGLSCAEGLPGMWALAKHLDENIPKVIEKKLLSEWNKIAKLIKDNGNLEEALIKIPPSETLQLAISKVVSNYILTSESLVIAKLISGERTLRLTKLIEHLVKPTTGIPIITTNYDRLIEIATEMAGIGVDTMFSGSLFARLNEKESRMSFCQGVTLHKKQSHVRLNYKNRIVLFKPHGSIDWFLYNEEPLRSSLILSDAPLIITPGLNKFRTGYERPFDAHRNKANDAIDNASRFLIIGYGFNDDHLQTHLEPRLKEGIPALLLSEKLSENGKRILKKSKNMSAIVSGDKNTNSKYLKSDTEESIEIEKLWDLEIFIKEVLKI